MTDFLLCGADFCLSMGGPGVDCVFAAGAKELRCMMGTVVDAIFFL